MKILYIADPLESVKLRGFFNDYLCDLLFHGLYSLPDVEVTDAFELSHLYKARKDLVPMERIWGGGFSTCFLIDEHPDSIDRSNIQEKIHSKYYDYIIYGSICSTQFALREISKIYGKDKIILIEGEDVTGILALYVETQLKSVNDFPHIFKREIGINTQEKFNNNLKPIHFAIPECKIRDKINYNNNILKSIATCVPGIQETYIYKDEQSYYDNIYNSIFAITMSKAGWDCIRHYEIMANGCIPLFFNFENKPPQTLTNLDPDLIRRCWLAAQNFQLDHSFKKNDDLISKEQTLNPKQEILDLKEEILEYTKQHLTTKKLAQYVLENV
tara:strand:- start:3870 stop:4856 length:987 start_codon:yes stop_codon:yes gene_type:complete